MSTQSSTPPSPFRSTRASLAPTTSPDRPASYAKPPASYAKPAPIQSKPSPASGKDDKTKNLGRYFLLFIVIAIIVWVILYVWKPSWVMQKDANGNATTNINNWAIILWSVIVSLIITAIIWLFQSY